MASIYDRWHKSRPKPGEPVCGEHGHAPAADHGRGNRWQVQWRDGGRQRSANFRTRAEAETYRDRLGQAWCIVPKCRTSAVTEPPVLLCGDHRDLLLQQLGRKRPAVHEPLVYFIRNGGRIKIGWTTNLRSRLSSLSLPRDAVALTVPGGPEMEALLHGRFAASRVGRTEWFEATGDLEDYIAARA